MYFQGLAFELTCIYFGLKVAFNSHVQLARSTAGVCHIEVIIWFMAITILITDLTHLQKLIMLKENYMGNIMGYQVTH